MSQESASYQLSRLSVVAAAAEVSSTSFVSVVTLGDAGPSGAGSVCNDGYATTMGFASASGQLPVALVLRAMRDPLDPQIVILAWSGLAEAFDIHRGNVAEGLAEPALVVSTTTACGASDAPPAAEPAIFYLVLEAPP